MNAEKTPLRNRQRRASHRWSLIAAFAAAFLLTTTPVVQASEITEAIGQRMEDPLLTQPPILQGGVILPGDFEPIACARDVNATPLDLASAIDIALCSNPQVKGAWATIKQQAAALGEARAANLPTASMGASRTNDKTWFPNSDAPGSSRYGNTIYANLNWRLLDGGTRSANSAMAASLLEAALANHDAALQRTMTDAIQAYFDAQSARAAWMARTNNESLARQTLDAAMRRETKGASAQTDTLQATTAFAKATLDKSRAQGAFRKAIAVLVFVLGVSPDMQFDLAEDVTDAGEGLQQSLSSWLEEAQSRHPAIIAARAQLAAADAKVLGTQSEGRPTLDLTSNFYQNGRPTQGLPTIKTRERLIGITLTIPLFEGFARTYKIRGAQAQVEQKQADLSNTEHQVLMELVKAHSEATSSLENLAASRRLLEAAQASLATVQRKFERGAADILEILNVQSALADAQQERIRCLAEWRSARLRLLTNAGIAGRSAIVN